MPLPLNSPMVVDDFSSRLSQRGEREQRCRAVFCLPDDVPIGRPLSIGISNGNRHQMHAIVGRELRRNGVRLLVGSRAERKVSWTSWCSTDQRLMRFPGLLQVKRVVPMIFAEFVGLGRSLERDWVNSRFNCRKFSLYCNNYIWNWLQLTCWNLILSGRYRAVWIIEGFRAGLTVVGLLRAFQ